MIRLSNVTKRYSSLSDSAALDGIDLTIERGEFVAVMGPSGSGKTTMLNIVGLIDTPSSGRYVFGDEDLSSRSVDELTELRRRHVSFIFQSFHLISDLNVYENVELPLRYQKVPRARGPIACARCSSSSVSTHARSNTPTRSRAASSNASRSRARSSTIPR